MLSWFGLLCGRARACLGLAGFEQKIHDCMNKVSTDIGERDESPSAAQWSFRDNPSMFQLLFERSADALLLFDPKANVFVDCNSAAVELLRANSKEQLLGA